MKYAVIFAGAVLLLPGVAAAQEAGTDYGFAPGDRTATLSGSGINSKDFDDGNFGVAGSIDWFVIDNLAVGVRQDLNWADNEDNDDTWAGATRLAADYHFDLARLQPFIGASVGYIYGDAVNEAWVAGPEGGLKFFVNNTTYLFGQTAYQFDLEDGFDEGSWIHNVGVGFKF
ncbi:MAG: hypothetical protein K0S81_2082 [Rhodospirillales bacterium]|jgi:hypothetical protein|nr:hypothetical protein [Rhodospirillales bacterium]